MTASQLRLDIRSHRNTASGAEAFYWVAQTTAPVTDRARQAGDSPTRADAIFDYFAAAKALGWTDDVDSVSGVDGADFDDPGGTHPR